MFRRLLVPLDGSPLSASAIPVAMDLARRLGGQVHFVLVSEPPRQAPGEPLLDPVMVRAMTAEHRRYLAGVLAREGGGEIEVTGEVLDGPVLHTLIKAVQDHAPDLVVMASHGRGGFSRFWLGSVATGMVRGAPAPILLLRQSDDTPPAPLSWSKVLLPFDATGFGDEIMWQALALAGTEGVEYRAVVVVPAMPVVLSAASPDHDRALFERRTARAEDYLATIQSGLEGRGARCRTEVLSGSGVGRVLLDYVEVESPDLIAMSTHGRTEVGRFLMGSVADKVVRGSTVPILLRGPAA